MRGGGGGGGMLLEGVGFCRDDFSKSVKIATEIAKRGGNIRACRLPKSRRKTGR